jgi:hypothetical protein
MRPVITDFFIFSGALQTAIFGARLKTIFEDFESPMVHNPIFAYSFLSCPVRTCANIRVHPD